MCCAVPPGHIRAAWLLKPWATSMGGAGTCHNMKADASRRWLAVLKAQMLVCWQVLSPWCSRGHNERYKGLSVCAVQSQHQVSRALRLWTHSENLPILVHCIHGKDRTGLIVALLLRLIDVPLEVCGPKVTKVCKVCCNCVKQQSGGCIQLAV